MPGRRWRVYKIERAPTGGGDRVFLERVFHKLLLNFTWWVNRKDAEGNNIFEGGFLGLDNIGVFDRSAPLPTGGHLEQADGTSWMAMYSAQHARHGAGAGASDDPVYEDIASKFWEHFLLHRARHVGDRRRRRTLWPVGRRGRVLLRRAAHARRPPHPAEGPLDGRADSALRDRDARAVHARADGETSGGAWSGSSRIART